MCEENSNQKTKLIINMLIAFFVIDTIFCAYIFNKLNVSDKPQEAYKAEIGYSAQRDVLPAENLTVFMNDLQRDIKKNWRPPSSNTSKKVVVMMVINRNGDLESAKIHKSSGDDEIDAGALYAVESTAPFRPLPADFKDERVNIEFSFDYNVVNENEHKTAN